MVAQERRGDEVVVGGDERGVASRAEMTPRWTMFTGAPCPAATAPAAALSQIRLLPTIEAKQRLLHDSFTRPVYAFRDLGKRRRACR